MKTKKKSLKEAVKIFNSLPYEEKLQVVAVVGISAIIIEVLRIYTNEELKNGK